jgi:sortase A
MILGAACLLAAVGFVIYNRWEAKRAGELTQSLLEDVQLGMEKNQTNPPLQREDGDQDAAQIDVFQKDAYDPTEMATIKVDGYDCIGILSVPVLELELPVLTDWSYTKLKKAPCHYYGSYYEKDFVIAAHNYQTHFGKLPELLAGDIVIFTDVNGAEHCYEVVLLETLPKEATQEMITSGFDLSLYTCTPGGASRVTVRCNAIAG